MIIYDAHNVIEDLKDQVNYSALMFYLWMRGKHSLGTGIENLMNYGFSKRHTLRVLAELKEEGLVEVKSYFGTNKVIYKPK